MTGMNGWNGLGKAVNGGTEEPIQMRAGKNGNENILFHHIAPHLGIPRRARSNLERKFLIYAAERDRDKGHNSETLC
jgi:hypothetical protein